MKILLSPTKKQIENPSIKSHSIPHFIESAKSITKFMLGLGETELQKILNISRSISNENWKRLNSWEIESYNPAITTFVGEAFNYLDPASFSDDDLSYANDNLFIFSGLYGILRPLDSIKPYRLDIKDKINLDGYRSLYHYWSENITNFLIDEIGSNKNELIIDLSSKEYSKAVTFKSLPCKTITPEFKSLVDGKLKTVAIWSKRMRGLLAREIIINRVKDEETLKKVVLEDYYLDSFNNGKYLYIKR